VESGLKDGQESRLNEALFNGRLKAQFCGPDFQVPFLSIENMQKFRVVTGGGEEQDRGQAPGYINTEISIYRNFKSEEKTVIPTPQQITASN